MVAVKQRARKARGPGQPRASITFPPELYQTLEDLAKRKKVSLAWVVRDAAEKYVARRTAETKKATPKESQ
ncbi:MAG TPA: CopG family transcriptional regulator [Spirochaetia bacterium]|nr:CopG family transcriptional regulator [Spirochaetia bacterium]